MKSRNQNKNTTEHKYLCWWPSRIPSTWSSTSLQVFQGVAVEDNRDRRRSYCLEYDKVSH